MSKIFKKLQNTMITIKNETVHQFDIFGQLPSFTVLNKSRYTSNFGFLMSLVIGCLALYYLNSEIVSMILKQMPSIYQSEIQVVETEEYSLTNKNFTLAVSIASQFSEPKQGINKYYRLNISQCIRQRIKDEQTGNTTVLLNCQDIPIETCNMSHFRTELQKEYFSTIRFGTVQCINSEYLQQNPLKLQGQFNAQTYKYLIIRFKPCHNTTDFQGCAPQEEINQVLEQGQYNVYKSDFLTQFESRQPYQQIITNEFTSFTLSTSKTIVHSYRIMQTQTDHGLIWEDDSQDVNLQQSEWREVSEFYNHQYLVCHYIKLDFKQTNIKRTYIKLQTILAKIGGILQILTMIVGIFLKPLIDNLMKFEIASSLYSYEDDLQDQISSSGQILSIEREIQSPSNKLPSFCSIDQNTQNKESKNQSSCFQNLLIIFGFKKFQHQQFCKAKKKIIKNLDIVTILKKLQDLDLIKKILLSREQLEQLKRRPRPKISVKLQDSIIEKSLHHHDQLSSNSNLFPQQILNVAQPQQTIKSIFRTYIESQFLQYLHNSQTQSEIRAVEKLEQIKQNPVEEQIQSSHQIQTINLNNPINKSQQIDKKFNLEVSIEK
ncbi:unnamed protein product [Paramecium pentaurelia]|uniref:Transmembrane protein n=1 Tax=Paramecium pentaurelia TaxID=43138 RepID=A0A8S1WGC6_9CILI|nr:unnamed protein product [Paramecium pentaurelia]